MNKSFRLGIRKRSFVIRVAKHWHRFPKGVVDAPLLEVLKVRLDGALTTLI